MWRNQRKQDLQVLIDFLDKKAGGSAISSSNFDTAESDVIHRAADHIRSVGYQQAQVWDDPIRTATDAARIFIL